MWSKEGTVICQEVASNPGKLNACTLNATHNMEHYKVIRKQRGQRNTGKTVWNRLDSNQRDSLARGLLANPEQCDALMQTLGRAQQANQGQFPAFQRTGTPPRRGRGRGRRFNRGGGNQHDSGSSGGGGFTFMIRVLLGSAVGAMLPIAIDRKLPHIQLTFGRKIDDLLKCPSVYGVVDSGASITTANLTFMANLVRAFPHICAEIIVAKDSGYRPIRLSGIIAEDSDGVTTADLPVLFKLYMPYMMTNGNETYLHVACGTCVSVNFLIGITFLKGAKATLSFDSNSLNCPNFEGGHHFPVDYRVPTLTRDLPSSPVTSRSGSSYQKTTQEVDHILAYFCPQPKTIESNAKKVRFSQPPPSYLHYGPQPGVARMPVMATVAAVANAASRTNDMPPFKGQVEVGLADTDTAPAVPFGPLRMNAPSVLQLQAVAALAATGSDALALPPAPAAAAQSAAKPDRAMDDDGFPLMGSSLV